MSFQYSVSLDDPYQSSKDAALVADVEAAAAQWAQVLSGLGTMDIIVNVNYTTPFADGGPEAAVAIAIGTDGTQTLVEGGVEYELKTGIDANGALPDMVINLNPDYLNSLWLDPNHEAAMPFNDFDGLSTFIHEIGHGLGLIGYRDQSDGTLPSYETTWDRLVTINADGSASFVGANAEKVYGGPVPVTTLKNGEQYFHLGNSASDADAKDVMNGISLYNGQHYAISALDVAIMKDIGLTTSVDAANAALETVTPGNASTPATDTFRFFDTQDGGHFFTTSTVERDNVLATRPDLKFEGVGFQAYNAEKDGTAPVYRFFDTHDGGHFFTIDPGERDTVLATRPDFKFEGIGYYESATSQGNNTDAVYRFFDTLDGGHFFTSSTTERDTVLATRPDLHFEGIAFYAPHLVTNPTA